MQHVHGVGGVGVIAFIELAHMLDATELMGWVVGVIAFIELAHMLDATELMGWVVGVIGSLN